MAICTTEAGGTVEISVADTGTGIAPELLPHIFDRYLRRSGGPSAHAPGGMGLGLVIVERMLALHASQIRAETRPGAGTRFWFTLPTER